GTKKLYVFGLLANLVAMSLLVVSQFFTGQESTAYALLLLATASLGVGFGLTVPALNTFTAAFNPSKVDASVLVLNALLGLGTALAPVFVALFVGLGFWWGLPVLSGALLVLLLLNSLRLPLETAAPAGGTTGRTTVPPRFWWYAAFAVTYGICETMNGNWSSLAMQDLGASATQASLALTTFWAAVTIGRVGLAMIERRFPERRAYRLLPFLLTAVFLAISALPSDQPGLGILVFGLAGLGCSALLPLTISFGQGELVAMSGAVAGGVIAFYQFGYGIAAFGAGPLEESGIELSTLFGYTAVVALVMGVIALTITGRQTTSPRSVPSNGAGRLANGH
ncbi:MAG TPA: MFS transporter, partial [Acidimicrobiia bacterium]|nr:MFS transporter [Acidimicrobiia bacterium]